MGNSRLKWTKEWEWRLILDNLNLHSCATLESGRVPFFCYSSISTHRSSLPAVAVRRFLSSKMPKIFITGYDKNWAKNLLIGTTDFEAKLRQTKMKFNRYDKIWGKDSSIYINKIRRIFRQSWGKWKIKLIKYEKIWDKNSSIYNCMVRRFLGKVELKIY